MTIEVTTVKAEICILAISYRKTKADDSLFKCLP